MELLKSTRTANGRPTSLGDGFQPRRVVVVVDAMTELTLTALQYALENFVRPADNLSLVGILHPFVCSVGYEQKEDLGSKCDGNVENVLTEAMWKKHAELWQKSITNKDIYRLVVSKKVIFDIRIATGPDRKLAMAKQAVDLRASWIILDQDLRKDKAYLMKQLNCNVVLMTSKCEATIIKVELPRAEHPNALEWKERWTTAVKTARALRYLQEECGVGCIVHSDWHKIPVMYDVVPLVGGFAHAISSQPSDDEFKKETRCMRMRGYLAPEYAERGSILVDKANVYSFGVLLLQLITGRKAIDSEETGGESSLTEWVRPMLQAGKDLDIVDSRLRNFCDVDQATKMVVAAARCICIDPSQRPSMSEVMEILEHDRNLVRSISIGSSTKDISDILSNPSTKCLLQTNLITLQTSLITLQGTALDSVSAKGKRVASNVTTARSQSHRPQVRPPEVMTSTMTGIQKVSSLKERVRFLRKSGKLSYRQMLL